MFKPKTYLFVFALFLVLLCGNQTKGQTLSPPGRYNRCPNPRFEQKHVEINRVDTAAVAARFAQYVEILRINSGDTVYTTFNTVFISNTPMTYTWQAGGYCIFNFFVTKYDCWLSRGYWNCARVGQLGGTKGTHILRSGHYEPSLDVIRPTVG